MIIYTKEQVTGFILSIQKKNHYLLIMWYIREHRKKYCIDDLNEFMSLLEVYKYLLF